MQSGLIQFGFVKSLGAHECLKALCCEFERLWTIGEAPALEELLRETFPAAPERVAKELILTEIRLRRSLGEQVTGDDYLQRFPQFASHLAGPLLFELDSVSISLGSTVDEPSNIEEKSAAVSPTPTLTLGRYHLETVMGRGGFGEVWRGFDPQLQRHVAIKVLRSDRHVTAQVESQFLQEGRKLAKLQHPGIVSIYDVGTDEGRCFLVSELLECGSLHDRLSTWRPTVAESVCLLADVADALHYAHLNGLVHRDVKPQNILLGRDGKARLADFGLAISEEEQLKESAAVRGTLAYMSPEQLRNGSHLVDSRSDIYSLGVVAYLLFTGRLPFVAKTPQQFYDQVLQREPRPPRTIDDRISPELERICLKCLRMSPVDRYTTGLDLSRELRNALELPVQSGAQPASPKWRPAIATSAIVCGLVLIAACAWYFHASRTEATPPNLRIATKIPPEIPRQDPVRPISVAHSHPQENWVPGKWINLLEQKPNPLIWPSFTRNSRFDHSPERREIWVSCQQIALLDLGILAEPTCRIQVVVHQQIWTGGFGIFFGFQDDDRSPGHRRFEMVEFVVPPLNKQHVMHACHAWERLGTDGEFSSGQTIPIANFAMPGPKEQLLEIELGGGALLKIRWAGQEIVSPPARDARLICKSGNFGLFIRKSTTFFRDASIQICEDLSTPDKGNHVEP